MPGFDAARRILESEPVAVDGPDNVVMPEPRGRFEGRVKGLSIVRDVTFEHGGRMLHESIGSLCDESLDPAQVSVDRGL